MIPARRGLVNSILPLNKKRRAEQKNPKKFKRNFAHSGVFSKLEQKFGGKDGVVNGLISADLVPAPRAKSGNMCKIAEKRKRLDKLVVVC
jgi:hypothetical protein